MADHAQRHLVHEAATQLSQIGVSSVVRGLGGGVHNEGGGEVGVRLLGAVAVKAGLDEGAWGNRL